MFRKVTFVSQGYKGIEPAISSSTGNELASSCHLFREQLSNCSKLLEVLEVFEEVFEEVLDAM